MRNAFTLVELLVALAILAILSALAFPAARKAIDQARATKCQSNMRQLGIAFAGFASDHDGYMPVQAAQGAWYNAAASWTGQLAPYSGGYGAMACPCFTRTANPQAGTPYPPKVTYDYNPYPSSLLMPGGAAVRIIQSKHPAKDVLLIDNRSNPLGQAPVPAVNYANLDPVAVPWAYPHPGATAAAPLRSVLFVDGHVEMRANDISSVYWQWPLQ